MKLAPGPLSLLGALGYALIMGACLAPAPPALHVSEWGTVRAESEVEACYINDLVQDMRPALLELVPGAEIERLEVWVQQHPMLYSFPSTSSEDAEGLYAPAFDRIMLARDADDLERVLAHEMTHAALDPLWSRLPGTLEEGLCDSVAARLVPSGAARLRAGRISGAALATGGLFLRIEVRTRESAEIGKLTSVWTAEILVANQVATPQAHSKVFEVEAGLSSTRVRPDVKRALYGVSFLLTERIIERTGLPGLFELCRRAQEEGLSRIPREWLLEAAELDSERHTWRVAAADAMNETDLRELIRMYPSCVSGPLAHHLSSLNLEGSPETWVDQVEVEVSLVEGHASIRLDEMASTRVAVTRLLRAE